MRVAFHVRDSDCSQGRAQGRDLCPSRAHTRASIGSELETALSIEFANENVSARD